MFPAVPVTLHREPQRPPRIAPCPLARFDSTSVCGQMVSGVLAQMRRVDVHLIPDLIPQAVLGC
jgi:hypothetical protein